MLKKGCGIYRSQPWLGQLILKHTPGDITDLSGDNRAPLCLISADYLRWGTNGGELVLPMHICLRSSVLQLPLPGGDFSGGLEVAEPVPYNTRRNWVRVPEHRDKTELTPEGEKKVYL